MTDPTADLTEGLVLDATSARRWLEQLVADVGARAALLGDLDRQTGDGDFGVNLTSALRKAQGFVDRLDPQTFGAVFDAVSKGFLHTGGTSGPLFGMWFREIGKAAHGDPAPLESLTDGVTAGLAVVRRLGGAAVGDKTMVDALAPAADALTAARAEDLETALVAAAAAARAGAQSTRDLIASRGRASYVGEVARGVLDPGAVTVALFFAAAPVRRRATVDDPAWLDGGASSEPAPVDPPG